MGGARVLRGVVVGVVVRDVVGDAVINCQSNTGCIGLTRREKIKKLEVTLHFSKSKFEYTQMPTANRFGQILD